MQKRRPPKTKRQIIHYYWLNKIDPEYVYNVLYGTKLQTTLSYIKEQYKILDNVSREN